MYPLVEKDNKFVLNNQDLLELAKKYDTPLYIYDLDVVREKYRALVEYVKWPKLKIFYAMKANWNKDILKTICSEGGGIDAVSLGDIKLAKRAGFSDDRIIYTANNITDKEMEAVAAENVIFNIGSLSRLKKFAAAYKNKKITVRFNPDVVAGEHAKVQTGGNLSKFGVLMKDAPLVKEITDAAGITVVGIHEHTGSGISDVGSVYSSMENLLSVAKFFPDLEFVDFGGGFTVPYAMTDKPIHYENFGAKVGEIFSAFCKEYGRDLNMYFEPGKYLSAQCGVLLAEVNTLKDNEGNLFAGINSGFSQLIRPMVYEAHHHIVNASNPAGEEKSYTIVGNICESGDIFAKDRKLPEVREGDVLAIQNAGAYCFSMGSFYNVRPMPLEIVLEKGESRVSTPRMSYDQLVDLLTRE